MTRRQERIAAVLLGGVIGDALGMPVENLSHEEIIELLGPGGLTGFIDSRSRIRDTKGLPAGTHTDDTQLLMATVDGLLTGFGFEPEAHARALVRAYEAAQRPPRIGFGGTTKKAMQEFQSWYAGDHDHGRSPSRPASQDAPGLGAGNAPLIAVAPLALYWFYVHGISERNEPLFEDVCIRFARMTHGMGDVALATFAYARLLQELVLKGLENGGESSLLGSIRVRTCALVPDKVEPSMTLGLPAGLMSLERWGERTGWASSPLTASLPDCPLQFRAKDFTATGTLLSALAVFFRYHYDPREAFLAAVNLGGDTDSRAALVGMLLGAAFGMEGIPREWRAAYPSFAVAERMAAELEGVIATHGHS